MSQIKRWERIAWRPEQEQIIYRDWGLFYTHKQQLDIAVHYYDKSLDIRKDDPKALYFRSRCKRNLARTDDALTDGLAAMAIEDNNASIRLEIADALYESNRFEDCKREMHNNARKFVGKKASEFEKRLVVIDEDFKDCLGPTVGPFILKYENCFADVLENLQRKQHVDSRPLWKILKEQKKCDVLSVLQKEEILLSPREVARRRLAFKIFNQIYFNKSWIDVVFLKELRENKNLMQTHSKASAPYLSQLTHTKYDVVIKFLKMLQARSALYNEQARKCADKRIFDMHRNAHLNRVQYTTRRAMNTQIQKIKSLRQEGDIEKLCKYVESAMGDYVVLKTHRVMPWKFEYINEVYNTLALAHSETYVIKEDLMQENVNDRLLALLRMPIDKNKDIVKFVFGDRSTYQEPDAPDYGFIAYKKNLARLEKRLVFSKYSIEKSYLLHEIARSHLIQGHYDECGSWSRKAVEETKNCNGTLWRFLSVMLIVKAHAVLHEIERCKEALDEAFAIAQRLKNNRLLAFMELCRSLNDQALLIKKRALSLDETRKRRSLSAYSGYY